MGEEETSWIHVYMPKSTRQLVKHFKKVAKREGRSQSKILAELIRDYVQKHDIDKRNPQKTLDDKKGEPLPPLNIGGRRFLHPLAEDKKKRIEILASRLSLDPQHPVAVARGFMQDYGLTALTVEQYMRELGKPIQLRKGRRRRFW